MVKIELDGSLPSWVVETLEVNGSKDTDGLGHIGEYTTSYYPPEN